MGGSSQKAAIVPDLVSNATKQCTLHIFTAILFVVQILVAFHGPQWVWFPDNDTFYSVSTWYFQNIPKLSTASIV